MGFHKTKTGFTIQPSEDDRIRVSFVSQKNKIIYFVLQYYSKTSKCWRTIKRYDTAHGYAHEEIYGFSKTRKITTIPLDGDYNLIYTECYDNIVKNWKKIKENYMFQ